MIECARSHVRYSKDSNITKFSERLVHRVVEPLNHKGYNPAQSTILEPVDLLAIFGDDF